MSRGRGKALLVATALPAYRRAFVEEIVERLGDDLEILTGEEHFGSGMVTELPSSDRIKHVRNRYLAGRRLLWQRGVVRAGVGARVTVVDINPRILSNWVILIARRVLRRRSVLWGHAWPRAGKQSRSTPLRKLMCRLGDAVLVYTESDRSELAAELGGRPVFVAPNAIYRSAEMQPIEVAETPTDFIYSGRLVDVKKPKLAIEAFALAAGELDPSARLIVVGDGPEREECERRVAQLSLGDRVVFLGSVFDPGELRSAYETAIAALSPGYVGLSMTQSHAYGLPMIYARDEPHAPEIEAAREGVNSLVFDSDDAVAFAAAIATIWRDRADWLSRRAEISAQCRAAYSVEAMADGFVSALG